VPIPPLDDDRIMTGLRLLLAAGGVLLVWLASRAC